jgi:hypothetical protein
MYCERCGGEINEEDRFCPKCGAMTERGVEENARYPVLARGERSGWDSPQRFWVEERKEFNGPVSTDPVFFAANSFNGPVKVSGWDKDEYSIELLIEAGGYREEEARANLDALKVEFQDEIQEGKQRIVLGFDYPYQNRTPYRIETEVRLPKSTLVDLDVGSKNGGISIKDLKGGTLMSETKNGGITLRNLPCRAVHCITSNGKLDLRKVNCESAEISTSNGRITLDEVSAQTLKGRTTNGEIEGTLRSGDARLTTSNGHIGLNLPCEESGKFHLSTSNGSIRLEVPDSPRVGYNLDLSTSMSTVRVDLHDLEYSRHRRTRKTARTAGFEGTDTQVVIDAHTSMGGIRMKPTRHVS